MNRHHLTRGFVTSMLVFALVAIAACEEVEQESRPFACGDALECDAGQFCEIRVPGTIQQTGVDNTEYECVSVPAECEETADCDCLITSLACDLSSGEGVCQETKTSLTCTVLGI